ncbi:uncharacterized protein LOC112179037 isoform X4 [Rosa chinensis]|uniref:uncharacterized protein LOC112179037 isoform X4 n=1 Tax=Rosa chinensis TaxID=74649 RepID=UPI001AD90DE4|nr:uncharacterized protein LOC112179037 isoform X4 [Rosa chinensis]
MADLEEDYEMVNWPEMSDSEDEVEINDFVELTQDELDRATTESFKLPLSESKRVGSEGKPLVIIDDYLLKKMDSGNKEPQKKTSLEEFDSEKSDFSVAGVKIAAGQPPVVNEDNGWKSFELPLSESKRAGSEGKPVVIIDDYIGCSKYFDSGEVDVKIFQEFPLLEKMDSGNKVSQKKSSLEEFGSEVGLDAVKHDHFPCALTEKSDFSVAGVKIATGQTPVVLEYNGRKVFHFLFPSKEKSDSAEEESTRRAFNVIDNEAEKDHKDESSGVEVRTVGGPDAAIDNAAEMIPPK